MLNARGTCVVKIYIVKHEYNLNQDQLLSPIYIHLWLWSFKLNISQISASAIKLLCYKKSSIKPKTEATH